MYIRCWISFCEADRMRLAISKLAELLQDTSLGLMSFGSWLIETGCNLCSHIVVWRFTFSLPVSSGGRNSVAFSELSFLAKYFPFRVHASFSHSGGMLCFDQTTKTQDGGDSVLLWSSQGETFGKELVERRETHQGGECEKDKEWVRGDLSVVGCVLFFFFIVWILPSLQRWIVALIIQQCWILRSMATSRMATKTNNVLMISVFLCVRHLHCFQRRNGIIMHCL